MAKITWRSLAITALSSALFLPVAIAIGATQACGNANPNAGGDPNARGIGMPNACSTPNDGCPCDGPATVVDCGRVDEKFGNYVQCSIGRRTCGADHRWGTCDGTIKIVSKQIGAPLGGLITPLGLQGTGTTCAPGVNDCDPYCNNFADDPCGGLDASGFTVVDAAGDCGLVITPVDAVAAAAGGFSDTPGGVDTCSPNLNVGPGNTCTVANEYTQCQQDFHCDQASGNCIYSAGQGWVDLRCSGVDLTLGAPCDSAGPNFPICNRGLSAVPGGTALSIYYTNPPSVPDGCTAIGGPADCSVTVPAGGLGPGTCMDAVGCPGPSGDKFAVINPGGVNLTECTTAAGTACSNNAAFAKTGCTACQTLCRTTVSGTVFDPGQNVPLPGVTVFNPKGALTVLPNGVACDSCDSVGSPLNTVTFSAVDGKFQLDVPNGVTTNFDVVFQTGRWRRTITVPTITPCVDNPIPNSGATETRLPKNRTEGDIPLTAIVTGWHEPMECLIRKIGVDQADVDAPSTGARMAIIHSDGRNAPTIAPEATTLWGSQAALDTYSTVLMPCGGSAGLEQGMSATEQGYFKTWGDGGGRVFMNHKTAQPLAQSLNPWSTTSSWQGENQLSGTVGHIIGADPIHTQFATWMTNVSGSANIPTPDPVKQALNPVVANGGFDWVRASDTGWAPAAGDYELSFGFNMPVGASPACGRAIFNGMHIDTTRTSAPMGGAALGSGAGGNYVPTCNLGPPLTPNELMFEYLFFELTACTTGVIIPSPPPPPPPLPVTTFTRQYRGVCQTGTCPVWQAFEWQSYIPAGTQIKFTAQTAPDNGSGAPGTWGTAVPIGNATSTTSGWTTDACVVDGHLRNLATFGTPLDPTCTGATPEQQSQEWLQVIMEFDPVAQTSPALLAWQQIYDCVPCK